MKVAAIFAGIVSVFALGAGCAHYDAQRAEYHQARARQAAQQGDYHSAAREERKAERAYEEADEDPLP